MRTAGTVLWLVLAGAMQATLAWRLAIFGVPPDFLLVSAICISIGRTSEAGAVLGFFAGLINGAILNSHMMALTVSRTLAGFMSTKLAAASTGSAPLTVVVVTIITSLIAGVLFLFFGVPKDILGWLKMTVLGSAYNALVALPMYWLCFRLGLAGARER